MTSTFSTAGATAPISPGEKFHAMQPMKKGTPAKNRHMIVKHDKGKISRGQVLLGVMHTPTTGHTNDVPCAMHLEYKIVCVY